MKLSDYVMRFIARTGVRHVFMVPGGGAMHLNARSPSARNPVRLNAHEQAGAIAAEAYARSPTAWAWPWSPPVRVAPMPSPAWPAHGSIPPLCCFCPAR